jgi:serine/threonine protein kinase
MPLAPGTRLSQYEILSPLGAGSMGEVYRARDTRLDRQVAIKVLPELVSADPDRLQRFEVEAKAAAALNHPNILAVYQMGTYAGVPYLVSELLEGKTLAEAVRRGPLPLRKAIDYGVQIAHGLAAAHEKGIVHRDLKPDNLFVTKEERVKILDFGLAKLIQPKDSLINAAPTLTLPGVAMGTIGYMSPEQVRGLATDHRTDIFAFGAILYEMAITSSPLSLSSPLPSRDGKKLFVIGQTYRGELTRYDAKSAQFSPFLGGVSAEYVAFSKDGQWVTYVSYREGTLWRSKVDGSERLQLTYPPMYPVLPRWSPDGKNIIFSSSR